MSYKKSIQFSSQFTDRTFNTMKPKGKFNKKPFNGAKTGKKFGAISSKEPEPATSWSELKAGVVKAIAKENKVDLKQQKKVLDQRQKNHNDFISDDIKKNSKWETWDTAKKGKKNVTKPQNQKKIVSNVEDSSDDVDDEEEEISVPVSKKKLVVSVPTQKKIKTPAPVDSSDDNDVDSDESDGEEEDDEEDSNEGNNSDSDQIMEEDSNEDSDCDFSDPDGATSYPLNVNGKMQKESTVDESSDEDVESNSEEESQPPMKNKKSIAVVATNGKGAKGVTVTKGDKGLPASMKIAIPIKKSNQIQSQATEETSDDEDEDEDDENGEGEDEDGEEEGEEEDEDGEDGDEDGEEDDESGEEEQEEEVVKMVSPPKKGAKRYFEKNYDEDKAPPEKKFKKDVTCHNCNETGHMSRECPTKKSAGGATTCFNCNETGHMSRECPKKKAGGSAAGRGSGNITCYRCNETGHTTRDCPQPNNMKCFGCQTIGHSMKDCPNGQRNDTCLTCGSKDHRYKDCPDKSGGFKFADCFVCKQKV